MEEQTNQKPKKKKKAWIVILIILLALLIVAVLLLWWFRAWFFKPHLNTNAFDLTFLDTPPEEVKPPTDEQMELVAEYVEKIRVQADHRLTLKERSGSKQLELIFDTLTNDDPDIAQLFRDLGIKLEEAGEESALGIELAAMPLTANTADGSVPNPTRDQPEEGSEAGGEGDAKTDGKEKRDLSLPQSYAHSSRLKLVKSDAETVTCQNCGTVNPAENEYCLKCGAELYPGPNTVAIDSYAPVSGGNGMTKEQQESLLLSNVANTLLLANYKNLSYYMAALACARDPYNVSAIVTLVTQLRRRDCLDEALAICIHGLEIEPAREELYIHAGQICISKDDPDGALRYFNRSLEISGFSGPVYQGMMLAYLQKRDFKNAFRCMVEGGKDGFTSSIRIIYDLMKMRGDYFEIAGSYFENHSIRDMMDFSVNRSGFNPNLELKGKIVDIGASTVPSRPEDWIASAEGMINSAKQYLAGAVEFYADDLKDIATAYDILLNSDSILDLAKKFMSAFGSKYSKEKETEAERLISYEQETFWLDILDDYREWKVKSIRAKIDEKLDGSGMTEIMELIDKYWREAMEKLEKLDSAADTEALLYAFQFIMERVIGNHSIGFTSSQSEIIVSKIDQALRENAEARNEAYREISEVLGDFYMYSNALLGMVANKELYNQYRRDITMKVMQDQGLCVAENALYAVIVPILAEPYFMIGEQAQEHAKVGAATGSNPKFPQFVISSRPAKPSPDMYADIAIPDISRITKDVLGIGNAYEPGDDGKEHYPAFRDVWEINWKEKHPGEPIPAAPNFNDPLVRESFWNSLTPEQRVKYSAIMANPDVVNATFSLNAYCGRGQSVTTFTTENIGLGGNLSLNYDHKPTGLSATVDADGTVTGSGKFDMGKVYIDSNGNMGITLKDKTTGVSGGIKQTGRDLTTFMGISREANVFADDTSPMSGLGAEAKAQVFQTTNLGNGTITSGGVKYGASAVLAGLVGVGYDTYINIVQSQSTTNLYLIFAGKKFRWELKDDYNYEDSRTTKDVPGIQEFRK